MRYLTAASFFALTGGHFLLTPYWLKRVWGPVFSTPEEFSFHAILIGFGSLQVILHVLACTVGISLPAGLAAMIGLHLAILAALSRWQRPGTDAPATTTVSKVISPPAARAKTRSRRPRATQVATSTPRLSWDTLTQVPLLTLVGVTGIGTCVLSWLLRSVQSRRITGIDANHYHVPYAVNFAHGVSPFGYLVLATDHNCPVGASILNAWFYHAFANPLCFDLVNLLPFLLLLVSLVYLFTLLTGERGWEWVPIVVLLLFTGRLFRVSLYISADLFYAATFAAVYTQLCAMWVSKKAHVYDWLALSLSIGMLASSRAQGPVSAMLLVTFVGAAVILRSALWPRHRPRVAGALGLAGACAVLLVASGGIWPIRNWLYFGSPFVPAGLRLFGMTIFNGAVSSALSTASASVQPTMGMGQTATSLRTLASSILPSGLLVRSREWMGTWPAYVSVGLLALAVDVGYQLGRHRHIMDMTRRRLLALLFFVVLFVVHSHLLVRMRGTDVLDSLDGQQLRYLISLYALYPLVAYTGFFTSSGPRVGSPLVKGLVILPGLIYLLAQYNDLTQMPPEWIQFHGAEDLLDYTLMPVAALIVAPWCLPVSGAWKRYARYASAGVAGLAFVAFVWFAVAQDTDLSAQWSAYQRQQQLDFERTGTVPNAFTGVFLRALEDQKRHAATCERSRYFMMSTFFYPLELQDANYNNLVYLLPSDATPWAQMLASNRPGSTLCDYVVAVHTDVTAYDFFYPAVSTEEIRRWLPPGTEIEVIGDAARYRVYHVLPARSPVR